MIKFYYGPEAEVLESYRVVPAPQISINTQLSYANDTIIGYSYIISVNGVISSLSQEYIESLEDDLIYEEESPSSGSLTSENELVLIDESETILYANDPNSIDQIRNIRPILFGIEYIRKLFSRNGSALTIRDDQNDNLLRAKGGILKSINFNTSSNQWTSSCPYAIELEFNELEINELVLYSREIGIEFFASIWDLDSMKIMSKYTKYAKLGSAVITDLELVKQTRKYFEFVIISTGMSTEEEVVEAIKVGNPDVIMHTNSTYPCPVEELNLNYIVYLKQKYNKEIGYSGHELELSTTYTAIGLGANWIERHITLDRNLWGSDQKASIEPDEFVKMVREIRQIEKALVYEPQERILFESENTKKKSLRKN